MLRFILDVLLLRKLIESRSARIAILVFLLGVVIAGFIYAFVVVKAVSNRSQVPHVHANSSH